MIDLESLLEISGEVASFLQKQKGMICQDLAKDLTKARSRVVASLTANESLFAAAPELLDVVDRLGVYLPNVLQDDVNALIKRAKGTA